MLKATKRYTTLVNTSFLVIKLRIHQPVGHTLNLWLMGNTAGEGMCACSLFTSAWTGNEKKNYVEPREPREPEEPRGKWKPREPREPKKPREPREPQEPEIHNYC